MFYLLEGLDSNLLQTSIEFDERGDSEAIKYANSIMERRKWIRYTLQSWGEYESVPIVVREAEAPVLGD